MTESPQTIAPKANGLQTVLNTIASPKEAFETLRVAPTWGWAAIITIVLCIVGGLLFQPANQHASLGFAQHFVTTPMAQNMSDAQKQKMIDDAMHPSAVKTVFGLLASAIIIPFLASFLNTLFLLIGNAIGKGTATFKNYFCSSMNVLVPTFGFAQLASGLIAFFRGPDSFNGFGDLFRVLPSLAWIVPGHGYAVGFFSAFSIFALWGLYLNATSMKVMGGVKPAVAWTISILILVLMAAALGIPSIFS